MIPHVWIIGFPRCGSVSLCEALCILGWNPIHNPRHWDQIENHNAAGDAWITAHWRELLEMFPESKFILNMRDVDAWLVSMRRIPEFWQSGRMYDQYLRSRVYGTHDVADATTLRMRWNEHVDEVRQSIPRDQLLEFHQPFRWESLCEFLDVAIPDCDFPWRNRATCEDARSNHLQH